VQQKAVRMLHYFKEVHGWGWRASTEWGLVGPA
jgi:hypothetical protein